MGNHQIIHMDMLLNNEMGRPTVANSQTISKPNNNKTSHSRFNPFHSNSVLSILTVEIILTTKDGRWHANKKNYLDNLNLKYQTGVKRFKSAGVFMKFHIKH
jgi:hypothetical protein